MSENATGQHPLNAILTDLPKVRLAFERRVQHAAIEVSFQSTDLAKAIGDVSVEEATDAVIHLFAEKMRQ